MGTLIAKTKGRHGDFFKVLNDDNELFTMPEDIDEQPYNANSLLEEDEWYTINKFSDQLYCPQYLYEPFDTVDFNQLSLEDYSNIDHLIEFRDGVFYFQRVPKTQLVQKSYLSVSQAPKILKNRRLISIDTNPVAIYIKKRDVLLFRNLFAITPMFKGIDELYREATQEEIEEFLENDFIELSDDYTAEKIKRANRKRISSAIQSLQGMSKRDRKHMFKYIQEYCPRLPINDEETAFEISDENSLKYLLYGIEERFYTTQRSKEKRLANSVRNQW